MTLPGFRGFAALAFVLVLPAALACGGGGTSGSDPGGGNDPGGNDPGGNPPPPSWSTLGSGLNATVLALAPYGGDLVAVGDFSSAGGVSRQGIARWNGSSWSALGSGVGVDGWGSVWDAVEYGGSLVVGGYFSTIDGNQAPENLAVWNGSAWTTPGEVNSQGVRALAVLDGALVVGGIFTAVNSINHVGGTPAINVARWNGGWSAMAGFSSGSGTGGVLALGVHAGELYAGGTFSSPATGLVRWTGSSWVAVGTGLNGNVTAIASYGGDLYVGGTFTNAGGVAAARLARWNGSAWSAVGAGSECGVGAMAVVGGKLYVDGCYGTMGGSCLASWDGSTLTPEAACGSPSSVDAIAGYGTKLVVGGNFSSLGGVTANNIAQR